MTLKPLLSEGDKIIDAETGNEYKIEGDRAILNKNNIIYKISLYVGREDIEGFETGNYKIVRKTSKIPDKIITNKVIPNKSIFKKKSQ